MRITHMRRRYHGTKNNQGVYFGGVIPQAGKTRIVLRSAIPTNMRTTTPNSTSHVSVPSHNHSPLEALSVVRNTAIVIATVLVQREQIWNMAAGFLYNQNLSYGSLRCGSFTAKMALRIRLHEFLAHRSLCLMRC
ncbi:unnamed protein product [Laminaria digitata]